MFILISSWEAMANPSVFHSLWSRFSRFSIRLSLKVDHSVVVPPYAVHLLKKSENREKCIEVIPTDLRLTRRTVTQPAVLSADPSVLSGLRSLLSKRNDLPPYVLRGELSVASSYVASPLVSGSDEERYLRALKSNSGSPPFETKDDELSKGLREEVYFLKPEDVFL